MIYKQDEFEVEVIGKVSKEMIKHLTPTIISAIAKMFEQEYLEKETHRE